MLQQKDDSVPINQLPDLEPSEIGARAVEMENAADLRVEPNEMAVSDIEEDGYSSCSDSNQVLSKD